VAWSCWENENQERPAEIRPKKKIEDSGFEDG
jgi:hypothetical protein